MIDIDVVKETLQQVWASRVTKALAIFLFACMFIGIGALWSPQSRAVNDLKTCLNQSRQLQQSPDRCWPYVMKIK